MTTPKALRPAVTLRPLPDSRPPGRTWLPVLDRPERSSQPPLDLTPTATEPGPPRPGNGAVQAYVVNARWCARADPQLPDARTWAVSLALAIVEALHARRPVAQLNRWLDEESLAAITVQQRRRHDAGRSGPPPALRSLRIQHPQPRVAEVSAHLGLGRRSAAVAFRLEGCGQRWLCTALELGPRAVRE